MAYPQYLEADAAEDYSRHQDDHDECAKYEHLRRRLPNIEELHKAWCKHHKIRWAKKNLLRDFDGKCHAVALLLKQLLESNGIKTRDIYGQYHGKDVRPNQRTFQQHGWLLYEEQIIIDPTRCVFDQNPKLGIWLGNSDSDDYDEGAMRLNEILGIIPNTAPKRKADDKLFLCDFTTEVKAALKALLPGRDLTKGITWMEIHYVGHLPPEDMGSCKLAYSFHQALPVTLRAIIPLDMRLRAERLASAN